MVDRRAGSSTTPRWFRRHPRLTITLVVLAMTLTLDVATAKFLHAIGVAVQGIDARYRSRHPVYHHGLPKAEKQLRAP